MGITIHYNGKLKSAEHLSPLVNEVKDIAEIYKWKCSILGDAFSGKSFRDKGLDDSLYGVCFTPPGCETVSLAFLSNGNLVSIGWFQIYMEGLKKDKKLLSKPVFVKTQYAGAETHKVLIHLLDYLSKKYLSEFSIEDEAGYWETRDENLLAEKFKYLSGLLNQFESILKYEPIKDGESLEKYFERILNRFQP